jgi:hypothetical protein
LRANDQFMGQPKAETMVADAAPDPELPVATPKPSSTTTTPAPPPVGGRGPHNETNDPDSTEDRVETTPPVEGEGDEKKVLQRSSTSPPRSVAATATPAVVSPPEATALVVIPALQLAPRRPDTARVSHPPTSSRPGSCRSVGTVVHRVPDAPPQAAHSIAIERKDKDYQRAAQDRLRAFTALTAATSTVPRKYHDRDTMHEDRQGYLAKDGLVHPSPRSTVKRESSRVPLALREQGVDIHHAGTLLTYLSSVYRQGIPSIPSRLERAADEHAKHSARELRRQKEQERILRREREALASASKQLEQFEENQKMVAARGWNRLIVLHPFHEHHVAGEWEPASAHGVVCEEGAWKRIHRLETIRVSRDPRGSDVQLCSFILSPRRHAVASILSA